MMIDNHPLKIAATKVLEDWAMMLVDPLTPQKECFDEDGKVYMSWVDIHGVINGALSIVAQEAFVRTLAANLLGTDDAESLTEADCKDAFKEMGNVLTGNFITEAYGDDTVFDLLSPTVSEIPYSDLDKFMTRKVVFGFMADDAPVAITFSIRG